MDTVIKDFKNKLHQVQHIHNTCTLNNSVLHTEFRVAVVLCFSEKKIKILYMAHCTI